MGISNHQAEVFIVSKLCKFYIYPWTTMDCVGTHVCVNSSVFNYSLILTVTLQFASSFIRCCELCFVAAMRNAVIYVLCSL